MYLNYKYQHDLDPRFYSELILVSFGPAKMVSWPFLGQTCNTPTGYLHLMGSLLHKAAYLTFSKSQLKCHLTKNPLHTTPPEGCAVNPHGSFTTSTPLDVCEMILFILSITFLSLLPKGYKVFVFVQVLSSMPRTQWKLSE